MDIYEKKEKESRQRFSTFVKEIAVMFACIVGSVATEEANMPRTSVLLLLFGGVMFVIVIFSGYYFNDMEHRRDEF
ncbi:MAG: hypothetical protein IJ532_02585 [Alphaproteobacteria bacterium]|nr:hypothetical protein [Alphaproteobacteria bacterium]